MFDCKSSSLAIWSLRKPVKTETELIFRMFVKVHFLMYSSLLVLIRACIHVIREYLK